MNDSDIIPYQPPTEKKKKTNRKPVKTTLQVHIRHLKTQLGYHIWHVKRIEKDLASAHRLHRRGSVLRDHARGIRPSNV